MKKSSYLFVALLVGLLVSQMQATSYAKTTMSHLLNSSTDIVQGEVISTESYWKNAERNSILTRVVLRITDPIKGNLEETVEITLRGGKIGELREEIEDTPELKEGDQGIFFLIHHRGKYWIHSISLGYYQIEEDSGMVYNKLGTSVVENDLNLSKVGAGDFQVKYNYPEFIQMIRSYVTNAEGQ